MVGVNTLAGKVALVTGASRGIGKVTADRLQEAGAWVARLSRSLPSRHTENGASYSCDVTDEERVRTTMRELERNGRSPDILISNAGDFLMKGVEETSGDEFRQQVMVNLLGPFLVLRELVAKLADRGGHIVTIGSIADHQAFPGNAAYGASKHGLRALHEIVSAEYRGRLRATLISPGPTNTSLWDPIDPDSRDDLPDRKTMLSPNDVADAVLFAVTRPRTANVDLIRLSPSGIA